jgi:hypothetical protein
MSYLFDGVDDRIEHGNPPGAMPTQVTIIAWVKPTGNVAVSRGTIHAYYNAGGGTDPYLGLYGTNGGTTGALRFRAPFTTDIGVWRSDDDLFTPNAWQAVAVTFDASSASNNPLMYHKPAGGSIASLTVTETNAPVGTFDSAMDGEWTGGVFGSFLWTGRIAYVRVFEGAILTQSQIDAEMNATAAVLAGDDLDCAFTANANDASGNNRHGTATGATLDGDNPTLGGGGGGGSPARTYYASTYSLR